VFELFYFAGREQEFSCLQEENGYLTRSTMLFLPTSIQTLPGDCDKHEI
jgi:hypothetical protein